MLILHRVLLVSEGEEREREREREREGRKEGRRKGGRKRRTLRRRRERGYIIAIAIVGYSTPKA